jgi:hypothetical protein
MRLPVPSPENAAIPRPSLFALLAALLVPLYVPD